MLPFGQLMLPVIGVVAIGLLVIGVKQFFFSQPQPPMIVAVPQEGSSQVPPSTSNANDGSSQTVDRNSGPAPIESIATPIEHTPVNKEPVESYVAVPVTDEEPASQKDSSPNTETTPKASLTEPQTSDRLNGEVQNAVWGVQIGAFTAESSAKTLLTRAREQGFDGNIDRAKINGSVFYRVQIPSGKTRRLAKEMAEKLRVKGYPTLVVNLAP